MTQYSKAKSQEMMDKSIEVLSKEFMGLRAGRASVHMLDGVHVNAYGSMMPLSQVGSVSTPEPRLLTVQVWDAGLVKSVEKAITDAGLGLNPQPDGALIRMPVPELNEQRRTELTKIAGKYAESARISIRAVRRDAMDAVKAEEKNGDISEDDKSRLETEIQKLTDDAVGKIDKMLDEKEKDIMTV